MSLDEQRYQEGVKAAEHWIARGGSLTVNSSSDNWSEARQNGFFERLAEERNKQN